MRFIEEDDIEMKDEQPEVKTDMPTDSDIPFKVYTEDEPQYYKLQTVADMMTADSKYYTFEVGDTYYDIDKQQMYTTVIGKNWRMHGIKFQALNPEEYKKVLAAKDDNELMDIASKIVSDNYMESVKNTRADRLKEAVSFKEGASVPAIAKVAAPANVSPKITNVVRKYSVYDTCVAMGLPTKINKMNNVVVGVANMEEAAAVLQKIYEMFGLKGSFMITWEGNGKLYFDPKTPVDTNIAIAYAKANKLALPSTDPKKLIGY